MKLPLRFLAPTLLALSFFAPDALACSCARFPTPQAEFVVTDAVFTGEVTHIEDKRSRARGLLFRIRAWLGWPSQFDDAYYGRVVTFRVTRSWKGVTSSLVTASTGHGGGDCGFMFVDGAEYIVYAYGKPGELQTGICSRTSLVSSAGSEMNYLETIPELPLASAGGLWFGRPLAWGGAFALALVVAFLELKRRRKRRTE